MSKRNTKDHPLRNGDAIIQAREILGPSARVYALYNPMECHVDFGPGYGSIATGRTWEEMLTMAKATHQAEAWNGHQIAEGNALGAALDSLRTKTREFLKDSKFMGLLSKKETRLVVGGLKANQ